MQAKAPKNPAPRQAGVSRPGWSAVDFGVRLFCHGFPLASCTASAIGAEGVSVTEVLDKLPARAYLELEFDQAELNQPSVGRIPVFVDKVGALGTNLLFTYPDEQHEWLLGLLRRAGC